MKMELGAQTFTVRDYMQTTWDFREAMKRIAEIGYTCVQLSAVGNVPVQAQRDICDEYGLKIVLTHTNPDRMIADPEGVIRDRSTSAQSGLTSSRKTSRRPRRRCATRANC